MPVHKELGNYTIEGNFFFEFEPVVVDGTTVQRSLHANPTTISSEVLDQFASFCAKLQDHTNTARVEIEQQHDSLVVPFLHDLIASNPQAPILSQLFPEESVLLSVEQVTPAIIRRATNSTKCWATLEDVALTNFTVDVEFTDPDMPYLFACEFNANGTLASIDIES